MTMPASLVGLRGSKVEKLPVPDWYSPAVWARVSAWQSSTAVALTTEAGDTLFVGATLEVAPGARHLVLDSWFSDEQVRGDIIHASMADKKLRHNCYAAPAMEWLVRNFPQEPIRLDGKDWIILQEEDLALAEVACPNRDAAASLILPYKAKQGPDAAGFYCPYIPLSSATATPPVAFKTRYDVTV